ncbi:MAG: Rrf2 family transcriptional regulator [Bdellovibrionota bacterium]
MVDTRFSLSVHVMMTLAYHKDELVNSEYLAGMLKTNPTFVRKIVSKLVDAELVESFRGKGGGVKIARSPSEIKLSEIYAAAVEEKCLVSTHKKPVFKSCPVSCSMDGILDDIVDGIEDTTKSYLSKLHLSDLLKKIQKK